MNDLKLRKKVSKSNLLMTVMGEVMIGIFFFTFNISTKLLGKIFTLQQNS